MTESADVVVVGGGIAGGALATVLARGGLEVVVLERQTAYRDKVRGEVFQPWGAAEARSLGLEQVLLGAGGGYSTRWRRYVRPRRAVTRAVRPGRKGFSLLNLAYPDYGRSSEVVASSLDHRQSTV